MKTVAPFCLLEEFKDMKSDSMTIFCLKYNFLILFSFHFFHFIGQVKYIKFKKNIIQKHNWILVAGCL